MWIAASTDSGSCVVVKAKLNAIRRREFQEYSFIMIDMAFDGGSTVGIGSINAVTHVKFVSTDNYAPGLLVVTADDSITRCDFHPVAKVNFIFELN